MSAIQNEPEGLPRLKPSLETWFLKPAFLRLKLPTRTLLNNYRRHDTLNSINSRDGTDRFTCKAPSLSIPGIPIMALVLDTHAVDSETLRSALTTFTEFFRNMKIAARRRSVLERAIRDGLGVSQECSGTKPAFKAGTPMYGLLSENGGHCPEVSDQDREECCRLAILFYICTGVLEYHDNDAMTDSFLNWLSALADLHYPGNHANPELVLCTLVEDGNEMMCESGGLVLFMSRMIIIANRLDRKLRDVTRIALLQFLGMRKSDSHSEQSLYPWDLMKLRTHVLADLDSKPHVEQTGIEKPCTISTAVSADPINHVSQLPSAGVLCR